MRACRHYSSPWPDTETEILMSTNRWNAWIVTWRNNKLWDSTFHTGKMLHYLEHLRDNEECRQEVGISAEEVDRLLKEIEAEWEQAVR
jgi:hypothetical protein